MALSILNVAFSAAPVRADAVGGAEQILGQLDQALVAAGHQSLVIACAGSHVAGTLLATPRPARMLTANVMRALAEAHRKRIERTLSEWPVDVVNYHGLDCAAYLPDRDVPTLVTLHLPPDWYPSALFTQDRSNVHFNCMSQSQLAACPRVPRHLGVVPNGVCTRRFRPARRTGVFALTLGRICPEKGFHLALDAARQADVPLVLAGKAFGYDEHRRYFTEQILPRLDRQRRFVGPVSGTRKTALLSRARCLVVSSRVSETSSLVAMEALACGTPVVAFPVGALAEIVEHGRTGFLVSSVDEMASALEKVGTLDRAECRAAAEQKFDVTKMCQRYIEIYQAIAAGRGPHSEYGVLAREEVPL